MAMNHLIIFIINEMYLILLSFIGVLVDNFQLNYVYKIQLNKENSIDLFINEKPPHRLKRKLNN